MAIKRSTTFHVTGLLPTTGTPDPMPGMIVTPDELRTMLTGGPGGNHTPAHNLPPAYLDAVCADCGESAHWCPEMTRELPSSFVNARRTAD